MSVKLPAFILSNIGYSGVCPYVRFTVTPTSE